MSIVANLFLTIFLQASIHPTTHRNFYILITSKHYFLFIGPSTVYIETKNTIVNSIVVFITASVKDNTFKENPHKTRQSSGDRRNQHRCSENNIDVALTVPATLL